MTRWTKYFVREIIWNSFQASLNKQISHFFQYFKYISFRPEPWPPIFLASEIMTYPQYSALSGLQYPVRLQHFVLASKIMSWPAKFCLFSNIPSSPPISRHFLQYPIFTTDIPSFPPIFRLNLKYFVLTSNILS